MTDFEVRPDSVLGNLIDRLPRDHTIIIERSQHTKQWMIEIAMDLGPIKRTKITTTHEQLVEAVAERVGWCSRS